MSVPGDRVLNRCDGRLFNVRQHPEESTTLNPTRIGRLFRQCPSSPFVFSRRPCPFKHSTMTSDDVGLMTFNLAPASPGAYSGQCPPALVICWTSSLFRSSSAAICWFDRFNPIKYSHNILTQVGDDQPLCRSSHQNRKWQSLFVDAEVESDQIPVSLGVVSHTRDT